MGLTRTSTMQNDEHTPELEQEENEIQDEQEETQAQNQPNSSQEEKDWKAEALKLKAILERQKRKVQEPKPTLQTPSRDELILIAKGKSEEDLEVLQTIAKGKGISLLEAQKDPLYTSYEDKKREEKLKEEATLGASKGSGYSEEQISFQKPGLTDEDHKKLWKQAMSK